MSFKHGLGAINQKNQAVFIAPMALIDKLYKVNCTCIYTCIQYTGIIFNFITI